MGARLLFCISPMTVIGGLHNGLTGDNATYVLNTTLDGLATLALMGAYGVKVGFGVPTGLIVQSATGLPAGSFAVGLPGGADPGVLKSNPYVRLITGAGGLTITGISWNLMLVGQ